MNYVRKYVSEGNIIAFLRKRTVRASIALGNTIYLNKWESLIIYASVYGIR